MKRYLLLLLCLYTLSAFAIDTRMLADSLSSIANRHANIGKLKVKRVATKGNAATVYTNGALGGVSLSKDDITELKEMASNIIFGNPDGRITIYSEEYELGTLITPLHGGGHITHVSSTKHPLVVPERPYTTTHGLNGKHIALWGSHGLYYNQGQDLWKWQRARLWTTVEDVYTTSYTRMLVQMLENAGAVVIQPRERDTQTNEVVARKDSAWVVPEEGNYAVYIRYRANHKKESNAVPITVKHQGIETLYRVNMTMGDSMWVYIGTHYFGTDIANNSIYSTDPNDQIIEYKIGGGMGSIARYQHPGFIKNQKSSNNIKLNKRQVDSTLLELNKEKAQTSGVPRWIEGARYFLEYSGIPDSVYNFTDGTNDYIDDYASRGRWVNYLSGGSNRNPDEAGLHIPIDLSFAWHTDAGTRPGDTIFGTLMIYTDHDNDGSKVFPNDGGSRLQSRYLGDYIQTAITEDLRQTFAPEWVRRQLLNASYSESRNPKVPTVLLELLSHQNMADMRYGLDPRFRFTVARAVYKGMLQFLTARYNTPYSVQPLPIRCFDVMPRTDSKKGDIAVLNWIESTDSLEGTADPNYYIVYTREEGKDWDNGVRVINNHYEKHIKKDKRYDFYVLAGNEGGVSFPSETLTAYMASESKGDVLIINGFDRISGPDWYTDSLRAGILSDGQAIPYGKDVYYIGEQQEFVKHMTWQSDDNCGFGMPYSDHQYKLTAGNTFDYTVMHGSVLQKIGYSFGSCSRSAIEHSSVTQSVDLVDVILGKERTYTLGTQKQVTDFKVLSPAFQRYLSDITDKGIHLLVSGAYIASDMRTNEDTIFLSKVLHCRLTAQHGTHSGEIGIPYELGEPHTYMLYTEPNEIIIHCENPDGIEPTNGGLRIGRYSDTGMGAGVAYRGNKALPPVGKESHTLVYSFPLESVTEFEDIYKKSINWLNKE